jgi:hypothetical protein
VSQLFLLTLRLLAPSDSAQVPVRATPAAHQPIPVAFETSSCLLGFCQSPERPGLPAGVMFLATGLVAVGVAGLVPRRSKGVS